MKLQDLIKPLWLPFILLLLFLTASCVRPLIPVDETRYMTVAWEMLLHHGWFKPLTLNFELYDHKPPLLFWLINLSWAVFGVSRWAALVPVAFTSLAAVLCTGYLGKLLFPEQMQSRTRTHLIMIASAPFLFYSTLVMFDVMLTAFVLAALICLILYSRNRQFKYVVMLGLFLGAGVLTKGPVAYLYVLPPMLLAPFWLNDLPRRAHWYGACLFAVLLSVIPVLGWLIPVLKQANNDHFALQMVWEQTAGRITGKFHHSHTRPFYFYLPLLPLLFMPWLLFPAFWRGAIELKAKFTASEGMRFLLVWFIPVFISFSCIGGKQLHYLVPLLPAVILFITLALQKVTTRRLAMIAAILIAFTVAGQIVAAQTFFKAQDIIFADELRAHPRRDVAYMAMGGDYHGEFGFLGRLTKPVTAIEPEAAPAWFAEHPDGVLIVRHRKEFDASDYNIIAEQKYKSDRLGLYALKNSNPQ